MRSPRSAGAVRTAAGARCQGPTSWSRPSFDRDHAGRLDDDSAGQLRDERRERDEVVLDLNGDVFHGLAHGTWLARVAVAVRWIRSRDGRPDVGVPDVWRRHAGLQSSAWIVRIAVADKRVGIHAHGEPLADELDLLNDLAVAVDRGLEGRGPGAVSRRGRDGRVRVEKAADVDRREDDDQEDGRDHGEFDQRLAAPGTYPAEQQGPPCAGLRTHSSTPPNECGAGGLARL